MKLSVVAGVLAGLLAAVPAFAQVTGPVGQDASGSINPNAYATNTDPVGFGPTSLTFGLVVPATATTSPLATLIITKTTEIATCSSTTGVRLPAVNRYEVVTLVNRSGGSCLVWPTVGGTLETAAGTMAAANAPFTMLTNTTINFRPLTSSAWYQ